MTNKRRNQIKLIYINTVVIVITFVMVLSLIYVEKYRENILYIFKSEDNCSLEIVEVGKTNVDYGSTNCKFKVYRGDELLNTHKFVVLNDYKIPEKDDFEVYWGEDNIRVIVKGDKQKDAIYFLNYNN